MTPEDVAKRCAEWATGWTCRVEYVEPDGPRRTWLLFEGGRQVGHVRGTNHVAAESERVLLLKQWAGETEDALWEHRERIKRLEARAQWTWEAAGSGRDILGLPPLQTP